MRAITTIAKAATRATWPLTRLDRNGDLTGPVVLCYHRVLPQPANSQSPRYAVTPQQFREQMSLLVAEGFSSLSLDDLRGAAPEVPPRSVIVTFDDGFADIYLSAWPIARELGITPNLFLCTGLLDGARLEAFDPQTLADRTSQRHFPHLWRALTWDEVREMGRAQVGLGFHSHSHRNYGKLRVPEIAADAERGLSRFANEVGSRPSAFAFPYGHHGSYSPEAISVLRKQGLEIFFTTEMGRTSLSSNRPISRFVIHPEDDIQSFRRKLFGGYDWVGRLRRAAYSFRAAVRPELHEPSRA
jgi:peptidoglycan/xylan/chitin deacetylase (PgdA/CDA1 family)